MGPIFQCVPNLSEGRRLEVVEEAARALRDVSGLCLLNYSADPDHNRSVFTMLGGQEHVARGVKALFEVADKYLDMRCHQGVHPRLGAVDVVPFVPLRRATMEMAQELCREVAERIAQDFQLPIYFYGQSATSPERASLAHLRRGGWEALAQEGLESADRRPDLGPSQLHPRLGASSFGARGPLVAFNVLLQSDDLRVAQAIARRVRARSGGLQGVKALGLPLASRGMVQISMNLTDPQRTAIYTALELVKIEAQRFGVQILGSELIGAISLDQLADSASYYWQMDRLQPDQVLETGILQLEEDFSL